MKRLQGFGARVLAYDIKPEPAVEAMGVQYVTKEELLRSCDVISLHLPLLPSTAHMLDHNRCADMTHHCIMLEAQCDAEA